MNNNRSRLYPRIYGRTTWTSRDTNLLHALREESMNWGEDITNVKSALRLEIMWTLLGEFTALLIGLKATFVGYRHWRG